MQDVVLSTLFDLNSRRGNVTEMSEFWQDFQPPYAVCCRWHMAIPLELQKTTRRATMARSSTEQAPLSIHRAFVVHVRNDVDPVQRRISGRVEHVVSGQGAHFASLDELLQFIAQRLSSSQKKERKP